MKMQPFQFIMRLTFCVQEMGAVWKAELLRWDSRSKGMLFTLLLVDDMSGNAASSTHMHVPPWRFYVISYEACVKANAYSTRPPIFDLSFVVLCLFVLLCLYFFYNAKILSLFFKRIYECYFCNKNIVSVLEKELLILLF